jgi:hypothetical protein
MCRASTNHYTKPQKLTWESATTTIPAGSHLWQTWLSSLKKFTVFGCPQLYAHQELLYAIGGMSTAQRPESQIFISDLWPDNPGSLHLWR